MGRLEQTILDKTGDPYSASEVMQKIYNSKKQDNKPTFPREKINARDRRDMRRHPENYTIAELEEAGVWNDEYALDNTMTVGEFKTESEEAPGSALGYDPEQTDDEEEEDE